MLLFWFLLLSEAQQQRPTIRQEIVVVADRAPTPRRELTSAATVCDAHCIAATPSRTAADLLTLTPGVVVFGASGTAPATIVARGFYGGGEVEYVQLRVDGIPSGDVESGLAPWQELRAEELGRAETARGMVSPLYGDTAVGGVVELFTRERDADWTLTLAGGNFSTRDGFGEAWHDLAGGTLALSLSGSSAGGGRPHDRARRNALRAKWSGAINNGTLMTFAAERRASDRDDAGPVLFDAVGDAIADPLYRFDGEETTRTHAAATLDRNAWSGSLHMQSKSADGVRTTLLFPPSIADRSRRDLDSRELGGSLQARRDTGSLLLRGGIDAAAQRFEASYFETDGRPIDATRATRDVSAAWGSAHLRIGDRLIVTAGLRGDRIDGETAWSPRLALRYGDVYVSAGGGFKAPTLEQLYDVRPLRAFGQSFTLSNPELVPQRVRSTEAGFAHGAWQADAYLMRVSQEIDFDVRTFRYGNIRRSEHRGVEVLFEPQTTGVLAPRFSYQWMRVFSLDEPSHAQLKNVPAHGATAMLTARLPQHFLASALFVWNGKRWLDDAESIALPDTRALSLRVERAFGPASLRLDVANATGAANAAFGFTLADFRGTTFAYALPDARRSVRLSVRWDARPRTSP